LSLNNFGVSPSSSIPGVGFWEEVLLLSHQRGKTKTSKQTNKIPKNQSTSKHINPKFKCNAISVSPSAYSPSSVIVSSKDKKNSNNKKSLGTALLMSICGCRSPATYCQPSTTAGFMYADLRNEFYTHLALQALFA
jgi:hypothetical protein